MTTATKRNHTSNGYSAIPSSTVEVLDPHGQVVVPGGGRGRRFVAPIGILLAVLLTAAGVVWTVHHLHNPATPYRNVVVTTKEQQQQDKDASPIPMPTGVNLGAWLTLEDYFFVGPNGALEVATPDDVKAAQCLPPLHTFTTTGPKWQSETDLLEQLTAKYSLAHAIRTFHAFRVSYLDWDEDLSRIARAGVKHVRVPLSWCLTDFDPATDDLLQATREPTQEELVPLQDRYTCLDPFFAVRFNQTVRWPAVPRPLVTDFLAACHKHDLKAILDIHTYPGGTSPGTFSGVWPQAPLFWYYDEPEDPERDVGRQLFSDFLTWMERMSQHNPDAFRGLGGITPMNEPAHLVGNYPPDQSYVPMLPDDMAQAYLQELQQASPLTNAKQVQVPNGPHLRVLKWQADAVQAFRASTLPHKGVQLAVNLIESIFTHDLVRADATTPGRSPASTALIAAWWRGTVTAQERETWAVMDIHHYHAWDADCQGSTDRMGKTGGGAYTCGDLTGMQQVLGTCGLWADSYRTVFDQQLGDSTAQLVSGEFSASTHHSVLVSCTDITTLRHSYLAQVEAAQQARVQLYAWSWKMPYGGAFRAAWSFSHLMYLLGVPGFDRPDESVIPCGAHKD